MGPQTKPVSDTRRPWLGTAVRGGRKWTDASRKERDGKRSSGTGTLAARELLSLHLKNYYYLPYKKADFWCEQRWKGFSDAIAEAGFPVRRLNHSVFRKKLSLPASSGVMAANDEMAELFLSAAKRIGVRVPHDIAVISA